MQSSAKSYVCFGTGGTLRFHCRLYTAETASAAAYTAVISERHMDDREYRRSIVATIVGLAVFALVIFVGPPACQRVESLRPHSSEVKPMAAAAADRAMRKNNH